MGCSGSTPKQPVEDDVSKQNRLRAEKSAKALAEMMAEVEKEKKAELAAYGTAVSADVMEALQRMWYGTTLELPADQIQPYLHATMSIAAVDKLSDAESSWVHDRTLLLGLSESQREKLLKLDFHPTTVEPIIGTLINSAADGTPIKRLLYYDALTMATQDHLSLDEKLRGNRVAELLALSEDEKSEIEGVVSLEERIRQRKTGLFTVEGESDSFKKGSFKNASGTGGGGDGKGTFGTERYLPQDANRDSSGGQGLFGLPIFASNGFAEKPYNAQELASRPRRHALHRLTYGCASVPLVEQRNQQYAASLLAVASASEDGTVSQAETAWLRDRCRVLELDESLFSQFFGAIGPDGKLIEQQSASFADPQLDASTGDSSVARAIIYDAITMGSQDSGDGSEMAEAKREKSRQIAQKFGLPADTCEEFFEVVKKEIGLQRVKESFFARDAV